MLLTFVRTTVFKRTEPIMRTKNAILSPNLTLCIALLCTFFIVVTLPAFAQQQGDDTINPTPTLLPQLKNGAAFIEAKNYDAAINELSTYEQTTRADANATTDINVYLLLSQAYGGKKAWKEAAHSLEQYIAVVPKERVAARDFFNLSVLLAKQGDTPKAIRAAEKALALDPNYTKAQRQLTFLRTSAANGGGKAAKKEKKEDDITTNIEDPSNHKITLQNDAVDLFRSNDYAAALEKLTEAAAIVDAQNVMVPEDSLYLADLWYLRGLCYRKLTKPTEANASFSEALHFQPHHTETLTELGMMAYNAGNYTEAVKRFQEVRMQTNNAETDATMNSFYGRALCKNKQYAAAIEPLKTALFLNAADSSALRALYSAYVETGKKSEIANIAADVPRTAQTKAPRNSLDSKSTNAIEGIANTYFKEGNDALREGDYMTAVAAYRKAERAQPHEAKIQYNLGMAFIMSKNNDLDALKAFEAAAKFDPSSTLYEQALGNFYLNRGMGKKAAQHYLKTVQREPNNTKLCYPYAAALEQADDLPEAEIWYNKAAKAYPESALYAYSYGTILLINEKPTAALPELTRALSIRPDYREAMYHKGMALVELKKLEDAQKLGTTLTTNYPDYALGFMLLARVANKQGDTYQQNQYSKMAKRLDPSLRVLVLE